jgi:Protein of unknown function (DUF3027)
VHNTAAALWTRYTRHGRTQRDEEQLLTVSPVHARTPAVDEACAQAVELARAAAVETADRGDVGEHLTVQADDDRVVTHLFASLDPAYPGWRWAVTVSRASRSKTVTVSEAVLLPGPEALLAPEWVPWSERVRPGDLGVGDLMPAPADDERLVPIAVLAGDEGVVDWDDAFSWEVGHDLAGSSGQPADLGELEAAAAGRSRVLSAIGRDTTAFRWYSSDHGPGTPLARAAPGPCVTCGFLVGLAGPLGRVFGVCANEYAPDDGRVVSLDHGCGAHSEVLAAGAGQNVMTPVIDEVGYDLVDMPGVALADTVFESLDHGEQ